MEMENESIMWEYQEYVQSSLDLTAKTMLGSLDYQLSPRVFFVGVNVDPKNERPAICIEPDNGVYSVEWFADIENLVEKRHQLDNKNAPQYSKNHISDKKLDIFHAEKSYMIAIKSILDAHSILNDDVYFVAAPSYIEGYQVFTVLVLDKTRLVSFFSLSKTKAEALYHSPLSHSLIESTIRVFLRECTLVLKDPSAESCRPIHRDQEILLREAEKDLMRTVACSGADSDGNHDLYDACNDISLMKYEGTVGVGRMIVAKKNHPKINWSLELKRPIYLSDSRAVRKFLELSDDNTAIISDAVFIYGLGELDPSYDPSEESVFTIKFLSHMKWELFHDKESLMVVEYRLPSLQDVPIDREKFYLDFPRIFDKITPEQIDAHWKIAVEATKQKHGTILVICDNAESEAVRLGRQGFAVKPFVLTKDRVSQITSIDGAVLIDRDCRCHAIGVILDGLATEKGNAARGSRYNSAVRYHEHSGKKAPLVVIIVSEDGMIDLIPNLMPQISHACILERIEEFKSLHGESELQRKPYDRLLNYFESNQFYLTADECAVINLYRDLIEQKFQNRHLTENRREKSDFAPHPDMNEAYYHPDV